MKLRGFQILIKKVLVSHDKVLLELVEQIFVIGTPHSFLRLGLEPNFLILLGLCFRNSSHPGNYVGITDRLFHAHAYLGFAE